MKAPTVRRCQECGGYVYENEGDQLDIMRAETMRALETAEKFESDHPFAYHSTAIPVAVVTAANARAVLRLIDELQAAQDELKILRAECDRGAL